MRKDGLLEGDLCQTLSFVALFNSHKRQAFQRAKIINNPLLIGWKLVAVPKKFKSIDFIEGIENNLRGEKDLNE